MKWNPATSAPIRPVWAFIYFFGLKKLIAVTSGGLFWCCLLFFSWNVWDNARTLSGLCSPSRGSTKTVKLMKETIIQGIFLVIALVKQKISNRLKGWTSLFADILLHYGARSSRAEMFWSSKCDDGTRSAVPVATLKRKLQRLRCLRTTFQFFP